MAKEYLDLKLDFMFKQLFGHPSRKTITIAFLNDLLGRIGNQRIVDLQFENTELVKIEEDGKTSRLDVLVFTSAGERINIEIQVNDHQNMPERVLYYWARLFSSSLGSGQEYTELTPTIMITILNYPLFPHETDQFHTIFQLREVQEHFIWSPHLEFHAFDLTKFMVKWKKYRREMKLNPPTELPWLMMLSAADYRRKTIDDEIFHELEVLAMNEQEVQKALIEWETLSANKENKALYEARLKYLRDELSLLRGERRRGLEEGITIGKKEGVREGLLKVANGMLQSGFDKGVIMELTKLSKEDLLELEEQGLHSEDK